MTDARDILRARGQYDPLAFPETGPDLLALNLQRKNAPGAPARVGSCMVRIHVRMTSDGEPASYQARTIKCARGGSVHTGRDALILATRDAERLVGHICAR